jgi:hypothetical protein
MITNHPPDGGPAVAFSDVVKVYHSGVRVLAAWAVGLAAVAMLRWRREATAAA